jgi:hypothetical protein
MSNASTPPNAMDRACSLVGRFLWHFGRLEQKVDQAIIKLLDLNETVAPAVTGSIDFAKKLNLVGAAARKQAGNESDKAFAVETCNRIFSVNVDRTIVAHSSFEPASGGGVEFRRTVTRDGRVRVDDAIWKETDFSERFGTMSELEARLDKLIGLIKPGDLPPSLIGLIKLYPLGQ